MMRFVKILFLTIILATALPVHAGPIVIIANNDVNSPSISAQELQDIFLGNTDSFQDGAHVVPVTLADGAPAHITLLVLLGKNSSSFRARWRRLVFEGKFSMPRTFPSEDALIKYVASTPGAVGYISSGHPTGVKVLSIK